MENWIYAVYVGIYIHTPMLKTVAAVDFTASLSVDVPRFCRIIRKERRCCQECQMIGCRREETASADIARHTT